MFFHGIIINEEQRAGGASHLCQAGTAAEAEIGTCLPWERAADPGEAVNRQSKGSGFRGDRRRHRGVGVVARSIGFTSLNPEIANSG